MVRLPRNFRDSSSTFMFLVLVEFITKRSNRTRHFTVHIIAFMICPLSLATQAINRMLSPFYFSLSAIPDLARYPQVSQNFWDTSRYLLSNNCGLLLAYKHNSLTRLRGFHRTYACPTTYGHTSPKGPTAHCIVIS